MAVQTSDSPGANRRENQRLEMAPAYVLHPSSAAGKEISQHAGAPKPCVLEASAAPAAYPRFFATWRLGVITFFTVGDSRDAFIRSAARRVDRSRRSPWQWRCSSPQDAKRATATPGLVDSCPRIEADGTISARYRWRTWRRKSDGLILRFGFAGN